MGYEILNHTADFGVRVFGKTLEELFLSAFQAVMDAMVEFKGHSPKVEELVYQDEAETLEDLLVNFLSEVIFNVIVRKKIFTHCSLKIEGKALRATLRYEPYDPEVHRLKKEIKSVTYHNLEIKETPEGFETSIICDV